MKSKFLLLFFAFVAFGQANAQDWSNPNYKYGQTYPGYIIKADGKKVEGFILFQDRYSMQNDILFYTDKEDKATKEKYKTEDLKEFQVAEKLYHCIHYSGGLMTKPVRANLVVSEGCITEYVWYDKNDLGTSLKRNQGESDDDFYRRMYPPKTVYKNKNAEDVSSVDYFAMKFSTKMAEFIGDNKELAEKVTNKEKGYTVFKILDIFAEYNAACAAKD